MKAFMGIAWISLQLAVFQLLRKVFFSLNEETKRIFFVDRALAMIIFFGFSALSAFLFFDMIPENYTSELHVKENIIDSQICHELIDAFENQSKLTGWLKTRHRHYPTTDIDVYNMNQTITVHEKSKNIVVWINSTVETVLFPLLASIYHLKVSDLYMQDLFAVKYDAETNGAQRGLIEHADSSHLSFNVALSSQTAYTGGGTKFALLDNIIKVDEGAVLLHPSRLYHSGEEVKSGLRYILVGFVRVRQYPFSIDSFWRRFGGLSRCLNIYVDGVIDYMFSRCVSSVAVYSYEVYVVYRNAFVRENPNWWLLVILFVLLIIVIFILIWLCVSIYREAQTFPKGE